MTGIRPSRSAALPTSGDRAYIPAMCTLIVKPMMLRDAPWWARWTGVIVITDTMTAWPRTSAPRPVRAAGDAATWRVAVRMRVARRAGAGPLPDRSVGSGRSLVRTTAQPPVKATTEKTNVPAGAGRPRKRATVSPGPLRLGPSTLPAVVDHTTGDSAPARASGSARSVAA